MQKTVNLIAGLRQLRALLEDSSHAPEIFGNPNIMFWIDALCIDQENVDEKSMQAHRMGTIYGSAVTVVAWLGENGADDGKIREIMDLFDTVRPKELLNFFKRIDAIMESLSNE